MNCSWASASSTAKWAGISHDDIEYATEALEPNSSAALLVWEDLWAKPLVDAMRESGGVLIESARIPHDLIEPALAALHGDAWPLGGLTCLWSDAPSPALR